jgi:hypothetical protein
LAWNIARNTGHFAWRFAQPEVIQKATLSSYCQNVSEEFTSSSKAVM